MWTNLKGKEIREIAWAPNNFVAVIPPYISTSPKDEISVQNDSFSLSDVIDQDDFDAMIETIEDHLEPAEEQLGPAEDSHEPAEDLHETAEDHNEDHEAAEDHLQPIEDHEPVEDHVEPVEDHLEPVEDYLEPVEDYLEPVEDHLEPTEDHLEPADQICKKSIFLSFFGFKLFFYQIFPLLYICLLCDEDLLP